MSESVRLLIIIILLFILLWIFGTLFMKFMFKRTVRNLLTKFRDSQAFSPETAKFIDELENKEKSLLKLNFVRDYSPQILQMLIEENIAQMTDEGKIYLSEQTLAGHRLSSLDN